MRIFSEKPEDSLLWADTLILKVSQNSSDYLVDFIDWQNNKRQLTFSSARIINSLLDERERVEKGQIIKLKNGRKRIILFNDDNEIILEIEWDQCNAI